MTDSIRIELVGGRVLLFSFIDRGAVVAMSEHEFIAALRRLVEHAAYCHPDSQLGEILIPAEQ